MILIIVNIACFIAYFLLAWRLWRAFEPERGQDGISVYRFGNTVYSSGSKPRGCEGGKGGVAEVPPRGSVSAAANGGGGDVSRAWKGITR